MAGSIYGKLFKVSTFGESHGPGLGGVIDGCPAGVKIDETFIFKWNMDYRVATRIQIDNTFE